MTVHRPRFTNGLKVRCPFMWEPSISSDVEKLIHVTAPPNLSLLSINEVRALGPLLILATLSRFLYIPYFFTIFNFGGYSPGCCHCLFGWFCFSFSHWSTAEFCNNSWKSFCFGNVILHILFLRVLHFEISFLGKIITHCLTRERGKKFPQK